MRPAFKLLTGCVVPAFEWPRSRGNALLPGLSLANVGCAPFSRSTALGFGCFGFELIFRSAVCRLSVEFQFGFAVVPCRCPQSGLLIICLASESRLLRPVGARLYTVLYLVITLTVKFIQGVHGFLCVPREDQIVLRLKIRQNYF